MWLVKTVYTLLSSPFISLPRFIAKRMRDKHVVVLFQVLGHIGYHVIAAGLNGYMATVTNLKNPVNKWRCGAAPITV